MTTKLYAVVDRHGKHASKALASEFRAWLDCLSISTNFASESFINEQISMAKNHGYHCIELHTYDPATHGVYEKATQVVVDREVYDVLADYLRGCILADILFPEEQEATDKFLSAGKE